MLAVQIVLKYNFMDVYYSFVLHKGYIKSTYFTPASENNLAHESGSNNSALSIGAKSA